MPPRRRLRVVCSSSEEDEDEVAPPLQPSPPQEPMEEFIDAPQEPMEEFIDAEEDYDEDDRIFSSINFENVTLRSSSNSNSTSASRNPNVIEPVPFHIPDSDSEPESAVNVSGVNTAPSFIDNDYEDGSIGGTLGRMGLKLRREWLESCIRGLESSVPGFSGLDASQKAKLCFEHFLYADMNYCGAGVLPQNVHTLHLVDLKGPFVLQVDEIVNISCPLRARYQKAPAGIKRCLKLSMTDGMQRVFAMEYRPIKDLEVLSPAGLKVVVSNVNVRRGLLMLVPEVIEVLGGNVEELDAAQQRLVQEVNKPPRGKRTRTGVVPPLTTRATRAAWPAETVNVQEDPSNTRTEMMSHRVGPSSFRTEMTPQENQGTASAVPISDNTRESCNVPIHRGGTGSNRSSIVETNDMHMAARLEQHASVLPTAQPGVPVSSEVVEPISASNATADVQDIDMVDEPGHPFLSTLDKETPFTYLASLSAKWTALKDRVPKVEGRIKCFLTGVKGFQYRQRATYELRVYVDDGSLISEILIDHNVVQKGIGHSPGEVTTALLSTDRKRVDDMKDTLKQFQIYLANFEGTMVVQMTEASSVPVAVEMNQGCLESDAWLLLERLRPSNSTEQRHHAHMNPIELSP